MPVMDQFSIMTFPWGVPPSTGGGLVALTQRAEALGFHSVTLPHHLRMPSEWIYGDYPNREVLDTLVVLPAMAQATSTIRIGTNSLILPLLPPYFWAKYLASLDVMSGGRAIAGVALGWAREDFDAAGADLRTRGRCSDEQLEVITRLWAEDRVTHHGRFYDLDDAELEPAPVQSPGPPIWLGGGLPSIKRAARYAEYLLASWPTVGDVREKYMPQLIEAREHCGAGTGLALLNYAHVVGSEQEMREEAVPNLMKASGLDLALDFLGQAEFAERESAIDPRDLAFVGSPEVCAQRIQAYLDAGVTHFVLDFQYHGLTSVEFSMNQMEKFVSEVVPLL